MAFGFYVKNSLGYFQIDGKFSNLCLTQSGAETISGDTVININPSPEIPLIAIRPEVGKWIRCIGLTRDDYGNFNGFRIVPECQFSDGSAVYVSTYVEWKCYRKVVQPSSNKYGLQVFNASGNLVFDSGLKYLKIAQVNTVSCNDLPITINYDVNNPYFLITNWDFYVGYLDGEPGFVTVYYYATVGINVQSSNSVTVDWFKVWYDVQDIQIEEQTPDFKVIICES